MKAVLAICALVLAASGVPFSKAAAQPVTPMVTATSNFGSSGHAGDHVQYVVDIQNPGEGYAYLFVIQTPGNLTLAAPVVTCVSAPRCAIDEPKPPVAGQPTAFVRMPGGAHETITVDATIVAAAPYSVAVATAQNAGQIQNPTLVTTLRGDATVETTQPTTATNTAVPSGSNVPPDRVQPIKPRNSFARWLRNPRLVLLLGLAAAVLATLVTSAVVIHSMRRAHWQKLLAVATRILPDTGLRSTPIPAAAPSVRINVRVEGGVAGPKGPLRIKRIV